MRYQLVSHRLRRAPSDLILGDLLPGDGVRIGVILGGRVFDQAARLERGDTK